MKKFDLFITFSLTAIIYFAGLGLTRLYGPEAVPILFCLLLLVVLLFLFEIYRRLARHIRGVGRGRNESPLRDIILGNRSCRRFHQDAPVSCGSLKELLELARLSPSAANLQPLKYIVSCDPSANNRIFPCLSWAGYIEDWPGPAEGERPAAYIIILGDTEIRDSFGCDHGIAAQSIMLGAVEKGLRGCIIGSIHREKLRRELDISPRYEILLVIALGTPAEKVMLEKAGVDGDIKYWRGADQVHHVPKRTLEEIFLRRI
ncbi:MAG: nitroreductase family protein [Candidatus Krumholzibacteriota bacterium]|nr:nitroreductase family protein [Candidatus Krumholzibacteriota bacterium]